MTRGTIQLRDDVPSASADRSSSVIATTNTIEASRLIQAASVSPRPARKSAVEIRIGWAMTASAAPAAHQPVKSRRTNVLRSAPPLIRHFNAAVPATSSMSMPNTNHGLFADCEFPVRSQRNSTTSSLKVKPTTNSATVTSAVRSKGFLAATV